MSIIFILIPLAIILTAIGIYLFFWAVKSEQFDDLEKQGMSILFDESTSKKPKEAKQTKISEDIISKSQSQNEKQ